MPFSAGNVMVLARQLTGHVVSLHKLERERFGVLHRQQLLSRWLGTKDVALLCCLCPRHTDTDRDR